MKHPLTEKEAERIAMSVLHESGLADSDAELADKIADELENAHTALNRLFRILHTNRFRSKVARDMIPHIKTADDSIIYARDMIL